MSLTIEHIIYRIADWNGRSIEHRPLGGGLTNSIHRVDVDGVPYVVRIPGADTELLAVDRTNEHHNTLAAASTGICPRVAYFLEEEKVMVLDFVHAETMSVDGLNEPMMPTRMAKSLKQLHSGPRFLFDFNMFRLLERYLKICEDRKIRIPEDFRDCLPKVRLIEEAFAKRPVETVPCHNDLLAGNYLDDGEKLWLIDFEYSGNNDPTFELGNTCQEMQFDDARIEEMCAAYFGEASAEKLARMKLNMIMSDVGWTLWGAIQSGISRIEFDFWGWAITRWERGRVKLSSPEFIQWLEAVKQ